jgi:hypothetical protein
MSTSSRILSATFTAIPGFFFLIWFLSSGWFRRDYWWGTYLAALIILLFASVLFGFTLPSLFHRLRIHRPWIWIVVQGLLAWLVTVSILGLLNATPLCVGQDNGDGNNDYGMCMFMTVLSSIVYTPVYLSILVVSSWVGHWMLSSKTTTE